MAKVLIVDDAAFMRLRLSKLLQEQGHHVLEASNGQEAVDRYREHTPDVVLMDITMPVMDGIQALQAIRSLDSEARVVMCSALGQQTMVIEAIRAGAKDFVVKPYTPDRVLQAVNKWGPVS
jgi:two-component system chemotaxis response regulator CheY